jgi:mannan endo-1,4-beta-mannosidase
VRFLRILAAIGAVAAIAAAVAAAVAHGAERVARTAAPPFPPPVHATLSTTPASYLGIYAARVPGSYAGVTAFTATTSVRPGLVVYYSGWLEPFQAAFAAAAANHHAVPLVQIEPTNISLNAIAAGRYDAYLNSYAEAVSSYGYPVILSFGHEMNGTWYSWGAGHASPAAFVAAWRHIVTLFRRAGADNVTWLWTVNVLNESKHERIPSPAPWWPGSRYVNWVGIAGYYYKPSVQFASLFGPTIVAVRELTGDPIIIAETGASPAAGKPAKISDLFAGVRAYGLLGFVWFDSIGHEDWRIDTPAASAAFRDGALTYRGARP